MEKKITKISKEYKEKIYNKYIEIIDITNSDLKHHVSYLSGMFNVSEKSVMDIIVEHEISNLLNG